MFWAIVLIATLTVIGLAVFAGISLKDSRKHKASEAEMMALKTSGAFKERKSGMDGEG
jgi:hypothetical protein